MCASSFRRDGVVAPTSDEAGPDRIARKTSLIRADAMFHYQRSNGG